MKATDLINEFEWDDAFTKSIDDTWGQSSVAKTIGFSPRGELTKAIHRAIKLVSPGLAEPAIKAAAKAAAAEAERELKKSHKESIGEGPEDDQFRSDVFNFIGKKLNQAEQELQNAPAATPEEQENKEFALKMFNFMKKKMQQQEQKQDLGI